jgi:hypothetical protein
MLDSRASYGGEKRLRVSCTRALATPGDWIGDRLTRRSAVAVSSGVTRVLTSLCALLIPAIPIIESPGPLQKHLFLFRLGFQRPAAAARRNESTRPAYQSPNGPEVLRVAQFEVRRVEFEEAP